MVFATKIEHLFLALGGGPIGVPLGDRRCVDQTRFAALGVAFAPSIKARSANPEVAARLGNVSDVFSISKYPQLALNVALILGH